MIRARRRAAFVRFVLAVGLLVLLTLSRPGHPNDPAAAASIRMTATTASARPALHVIPFPGTPDAAPLTHIIFSSLRPRDLDGSPIVTGSKSGAHPGRLTTLPDGAGTAFIPARPFSPGEMVTVDARLTSARAGTASGDPGARRLTFSFTVALAPGQTAVQRPDVKATSSPRSPFRSAPGVDPPPVHVSAGPAPGRRDIFLAPRIAPGQSTHQSGLMILNPRGQLLWFRPVPTERPYNLQVQRYQGHPVLTWWQGVLGANTTVGGQDVILDTSYRRVATLHAAYGYSSDVHDFRITPQGTAFIDAYVPVQANLSSIGGPSHGGWLDDCIIQELDIRTGRILWEWHTLGHVPLSASQSGSRGGNPFVYFHLNSIQPLPGHRLLISSRETWSVYLINELTGGIIWTLGGKYSSFIMGRGTRFEWQHDARLHGSGLLTLFDDGASPQEEPQSSAKELRINLHTHRVSLLAKFTHSPPLLAGSEGSAQLLYDHDMFVGWGSEPDFSEYTAAGRQVFDASFPLGVVSYRAYRFPWSGRPHTPPAVAVRRSATGVTWLYASWNGATQVARWRVVGGPTRHSLRPLRTRPWSGFETSIGLPSPPRYLAVQALDDRGRALGRTRVLTSPAG